MVVYGINNNNLYRKLEPYFTGIAKNWISGVLKRRQPIIVLLSESKKASEFLTVLLTLFCKQQIYSIPEDPNFSMGLKTDLGWSFWVTVGAAAMALIDVFVGAMAAHANDRAI